MAVFLVTCCRCLHLGNDEKFVNFLKMWLIWFEDGSFHKPLFISIPATVGNLWPSRWHQWNLESRSKLLHVSLTFLHNAQWGPISQLRLFDLAPPSPRVLPLANRPYVAMQWKFDNIPAEIKACIVAYMWFPNPDPTFQTVLHPHKL